MIGLFNMASLGMRTFSGVVVGLTGNVTGVHVSLLVAADEQPRANTMTSPSVMLFNSAPTRYPSSMRSGLGSTSITVTAASSVGLNAAVSEKTKTGPTAPNLRFAGTGLVAIQDRWQVSPAHARSVHVSGHARVIPSG